MRARDFPRRPQSLICPTWQQTYFAPARNFSLNAPPKSNLQLPPSCPAKRGVGHRHERWDGLRWTRQCRARAWLQGGYGRERPDGTLDERRLNASVETSSGSMRAGWSVWREEAADGKTVWSWHPLLVSSRRRFATAQPGDANRQFAGDGGQRNSAPGRSRHKP